MQSTLKGSNRFFGGPAVRLAGAVHFAFAVSFFDHCQRFAQAHRAGGDVAQDRQRVDADASTALHDHHQHWRKASPSSPMTATYSWYVMPLRLVLSR